MRRARPQQRPPLSPLTPVTRRRRRRRSPLAFVVPVLVGASAVVALTAVGGRRDSSTDRAGNASMAASAQVVTPDARARPKRAGALRRGARVPTLVLGAEESRRHRFRPPLRARGAVLVEAESGTVLWARYPHRRLPIASTTKIMTALLALERLRPNQLITIAPAVARAAPYREGLRPGERVRAWKLLYALMLYSGNDDALALAIARAGSRARFIELMNERARELGLRRTHFAGPSGVVDRNNYSTAWDMAALTRHAMRNPRFRAVVRTKIKHVRWAAPTYSKVYVNKNPLLGTYPGADGVKTGWTSRSGRCLVASARRGGVRLIAVVLGARDPAGDARRLLNYGFRATA